MEGHGHPLTGIMADFSPWEAQIYFQGVYPEAFLGYGFILGMAYSRNILEQESSVSNLLYHSQTKVVTVKVKTKRWAE